MDMGMGSAISAGKLCAWTKGKRSFSFQSGMGWTKGENREKREQVQKGHTEKFKAEEKKKTRR